MQARPHLGPIRSEQPLPEERRAEPLAEVTATDLCASATALFARERRGAGEVIQAQLLSMTSMILGRAPALLEETTR